MRGRERTSRHLEETRQREVITKAQDEKDKGKKGLSKSSPKSSGHRIRDGCIKHSNPDPGSPASLKSNVTFFIIKGGVPLRGDY